MTKVHIYQADWQVERIMASFVDGIYHLQCGLKIPVSKIYGLPVGKDYQWEYIIRFDDEKDAAWFVLAVGGKIYNGRA